mgnify:FL=1|jgi:regulatory protein
MKIKTRKKSKTISIISCDNENWGILSDKILQTILANFHDEVSVEISEKLLSEIEKTAWNKFLDFLSYRERSSGECKVFLSTKLFLRKDIQSRFIKKVTFLKYLNDERFAEMFVEELLRKGKSKREISQKLFQKKIPENIINQILAEKFTLQKQAEIIQQNIEKAKQKYARFPEKTKREKIINYLYRRGFSYTEITEKI